MPFRDSEIALLKTSPVLQDLPPEVVLEAIAEHVEQQLSLPPETVFIEVGQGGHGLYIIAHGTIETFVVDADGKEKILDFAKTGGTLAEETLFSDRPLQYSARSLTQAAVLYLPNEIVSAWIAIYPAFARRLMSLVASRIQYLRKDLITFCTKKATGRLVCYIVCHFDRAPDTVDGSHSLHMAIPRHKLASRLGISDSQLSRSFRELQAEGLIVAQGHGIFIPDVSALSRYTCPAGCDF
jgi:CRP/FNR family transcriptional regulator, dissimilatory nitrate respiration regulator